MKLEGPEADLGIVLYFAREGQGWTQERLARAAGISHKIVNNYERRARKLKRERLAWLLAFMGLPPERIDAMLSCLAANRAAARQPQEPLAESQKRKARVEEVASRAGRLAEDYARKYLSLLSVEGEALRARQRAEVLWRVLERRTPAERRRLVEMGAKFRTWALSERVCAESVAKAPNHPREALELAELALLIAGNVPEEELFRRRLMGYALLFAGNSRRACNELPAADHTLARARKLFVEGAAADPGFLNETWLPWIESSLRRAQRRFSEALERIEEALALDDGELRGQILLSKARLHETLGEPEASTAALIEAEPLIDPDRQPRDAFGLRFNLLVDLCQLEKFEEAEAGLGEVRTLAERLGAGEVLDLTRLAWLRGKVDAGLGRAEAARAAFEQARRVFHQRELWYDHGLVSLELAVLLLEQGATAEVRRLAEEMLGIFRALGVEREPFAALKLFWEAARKETATAEQAQRLVRYLYRAQHDPKLRFEETEGAAAQ
ncbi:MAG TPA: helix-turn-helix transcriptional regulator [Thermoanaerobaculia bacterium]|nr:helix-turn-helix transcriptional regulator [Thermoanaerobaculia bacterium]